MPEFAPIGQDHLLRSSSVIQKVKYGNRSVEYRTFEKSGTEVLRLSFKPVHVTAGGAALTQREDLKEDSYIIRPLSQGDYEVRLRHLQANQIIIRGD
jgi:hypothetical protein